MCIDQIWVAIYMKKKRKKLSKIAVEDETKANDMAPT